MSVEASARPCRPIAVINDLTHVETGGQDQPLPSTVLQPWQAEPRRLWSLLEMIANTARSFFWCGRILRNIRADCVIGSAVTDEPLFNMRSDLDDDAVAKSRASLVHVEDAFRGIGMAITADMTKDLVKELHEPRLRQSFEWLHSKIEMLEDIAEKELKNRMFLYISPERTRFWPRVDDPHLFGEKVAESFPSAGFDIVCSGQCLALGMATASVFHLMRVMEIVLTPIAKTFSVTIDRTNWQWALNEIEGKVKAMHLDLYWTAQLDWKEQHDFYAEAVVHFLIVKDAWRNHTMHARAKYSDDEAERIFASVRAFTQKLAERLSE